jgi:hypothetical protein
MQGSMSLRNHCVQSIVYNINILPVPGADLGKKEIYQETLGSVVVDPKAWTLVLCENHGPAFAKQKCLSTPVN